MTDFARIERAADGTQVLFLKDTADDGCPRLRQITEYEGLNADFCMDFAGTDEGWDLRDKEFNSSDAARAEEVHAAIRQTIGGGAS